MPARPVRPRRPWVLRHLGRIVLTTVLVFAVAVVAGVVWIDTELQRAPVLGQYSGRPAAGKGTNWLLVGSDSRQGLTPDQQAALTTGGDLGNGRTDTILLVHVPAVGSGAPSAMVSIPRDSYVEIPGYGGDKINAAYSLGGPALLAQTVEQATGLRLDHYAEIGFGGFAELVDAVGGVRMCLAEPVTDPLAGIDLPAGCQKLDGRNALGFVRSRATPRADLDRMVNQRAFMSALLDRVVSPAVLLNPLRWEPMRTAAMTALTVDAGDHVWDLARLAFALSRGAVTATVPIGGFGSGSTAQWDHAAADRLFAALASDTPIPPELLDDPVP
ncbi:cell envelope-related transcriptional attenuator [Mycolicibacterium thermoresistibile]|uniref:Transcriptional regulator n=1 Tax=Mycolicibacterium thermoresistibile TaxID=1797 RepID=A0A100XH10_MYCTH|nr:transcriptional regulator [Mycolicibacterium thermoresistibile]SNW20561.1 cell envelope-related transcriptional attenuator [Mycolicibacterium thermoresistibile]